jgi:hypothetical protein
MYRYFAHETFEKFIWEIFLRQFKSWASIPTFRGFRVHFQQILRSGIQCCVYGMILCGSYFSDRSGSESHTLNQANEITDKNYNCGNCCKTLKHFTDFLRIYVCNQKQTDHFEKKFAENFTDFPVKKIRYRIRTHKTARMQTKQKTFLDFRLDRDFTWEVDETALDERPKAWLWRNNAGGGVVTEVDHLPCNAEHLHRRTSIWYPYFASYLY